MASGAMRWASLMVILADDPRRAIEGVNIVYSLSIRGGKSNAVRWLNFDSMLAIITPVFFDFFESIHTLSKVQRDV